MSVKHALLALLDERPRYGYELKSQFDSATGDVWSLNVGQVYTTLDRLERDGLAAVRLVEQDDAEPQKHYELTAAGREALAVWWREVPPATPARDELVLKVLIAVQYSREVALEVITVQRTALMSGLQRRRLEQRAAINGHAPDLAFVLVNDALVRRAEADLLWLDRCEEQVLNADDAAFSKDTQRTPPSLSPTGLDPIAASGNGPNDEPRS